MLARLLGLLSIILSTIPLYLFNEILKILMVGINSKDSFYLVLGAFLLWIGGGTLAILFLVMFFGGLFFVIIGGN